MKGSLVALCLDLTIRARTRSRHSLDDVMRLMWQRWGKDFYTARQTTGHGLAEDGFPAIVAVAAIAACCCRAFGERRGPRVATALVAALLGLSFAGQIMTIQSFYV